MSQNPASGGDFASLSAISVGRSRGGGRLMTSPRCRPGRKPAGKAVLEPVLQLPRSVVQRGWRCQLPHEGLHPSPFSIAQAPSPHSLPLLQGNHAGWKRRGCCSDGCLRLGLYLDAGVPCNLGYWVRGCFSDKCTVAQVS